MKRLLSGLVIFFATLGTGIGASWLFLNRQLPVKTFQNESLPEEIEIQSNSNNQQIPEFTNVRIPEEFENGDFHYLLPVFKGNASLGRCELDSEAKRPWLGLFKRDGYYSLESVKVRFGQLERDDFGVYIPMHFSDSRHARFLLSHDKNLNPGPITTLYETPPEIYDDMLLGAEFRREFTIGERSYILRVGSGMTETGGPVAVLVLESEQKQDILYYRSQSFGESNFGQFEWVGDLDGDERLDLMFSFFDQNGGGKSYILFLSSTAKENHLVQPYAFFHTQFKGC